jgi:GAF domain-containing protein
MLTVLATKDPIKYTQPYIKSSIVMSKQYAALSIVLAVYVGLANYASKKIGPPWAWQSIKYIIDRFQKQIIKGSSHPKYDEHRVTLFKCVRWNFRMTDWKTLKERSGSDKYPNLKQLWNLRWFKPLTRSGPTTQRLRTWFPLYEEGTIGEGVIGEVWRTEGVKRVEDLPEIPPIDEADAAQVYKTYAAEVKCNEKWLRSRNNRTMARSYCGIPIEVDNGKRWGVIIIDSREPRLNISNEQIELAAVALGKFIEKA